MQWEGWRGGRDGWERRDDITGEVKKKHEYQTKKKMVRRASCIKPEGGTEVGDAPVL